MAYRELHRSGAAVRGTETAIRSVLRLLPRDGDHRRVVDFFDRHEILRRAREEGGCLAAELQLAVDGGELVVSALWTGVGPYREWLSSRARLASTPGLEDLLDEASRPLPAAALYSVLRAEPTNRIRGRGVSEE